MSGLISVRVLYSVVCTALVLLVPAALLLAAVWSWQRPPLPSSAPKPTRGQWPVLGALDLFWRRWDFHKTGYDASKTGNFSYYVGKYLVIAVSGAAGRKAFFDSKLNFTEGYSVLFAGGPSVEIKDDVPTESGAPKGFDRYFNGTLIQLLKRENFDKGLPALIEDVRGSLDELAAIPSGITDSFDSLYAIVGQLTMRTIACNDIANDRARVKETLRLYDMVEGASGAVSILFPWLPSPGLIKRTYAGARLHMMVKSIVDERKRTGHREQDPLQHLIDQGDDVFRMVTFIIGGLFAGLLNSGINSAYLLAWLAVNPDAQQMARDELERVTAKYCADATVPLEERLRALPMEAWENDFQFLDMCLRECIRFTAQGCGFRKNTTGDLKLSTGEVVPLGAYVTYHFADTHRNPAFYTDPEKWDPTRFLPDRAEDKKMPYAYNGWGAGRHPCLGMKFAKLEMNLIAAFFLARFDYFVCDAAGNRRDSISVPDINNHTATKPKEKIYFKLTPRTA